MLISGFQGVFAPPGVVIGPRIAPREEHPVMERRVANALHTTEIRAAIGFHSKISNGSEKSNDLNQRDVSLCTYVAVMYMMYMMYM